MTTLHLTMLTKSNVTYLRIQSPSQASLLLVQGKLLNLLSGYICRFILMFFSNLGVETVIGRRKCGILGNHVSRADV